MKKKIVLDFLILIACIWGCFLVNDKIENIYLCILVYGILFNIIVLCLIDIVKSSKRSGNQINLQTSNNENFLEIMEAVLLGENELPIRSWEMKGKTSLLIGKDGKNHEVDIDLKDTEYNALVDLQHAVLNYTAGSWYVEDLYSKNGIRLRKREDGVCYKIAKDRPCKLVKGDILLIANTKILFR